jgi:hypothetical protein
LKNAILLPLVGVVAFAASAAGGFVWSERSTTSGDMTASQERDAVELQAHRSAIDYVTQEFAEKPMERMQFLGYEEAIHAGMSAKGEKAIDDAAAGLIRAQECAGIMTGGHRTTITREAILHLHGADTDNPIWNRLLLKASGMASRNDAEPCRSDGERRSAPVRTPSSVEAVGGSFPHDAAPEGLEERIGVMHVVITPRIAREAAMRGSPRADPVRMRLD